MVSPNPTQGLKNHGRAEVLRNSLAVAASLDFIMVCVIYKGNYLDKCRLTNTEEESFTGQSCHLRVFSVFLASAWLVLESLSLEMQSWCEFSWGGR